MNTLASKRYELLGNADILRMRRVIHKTSTCVCLRIPVAAITQKRKNASVDLWPALRSKITSVARVEIVLLLRFVAGNVDVNTLASKRSEMLRNADILRMHRVIHNDSTCVCLRIPVAAITQKRKDASVDLWPALGVTGALRMRKWHI